MQRRSYLPSLYPLHFALKIALERLILPDTVLLVLLLSELLGDVGGHFAWIGLHFAFVELEEGVEPVNPLRHLHGNLSLSEPMA